MNSSSAQPDVKQLGQESLDKMDFPASRGADFRVVFSADVFERMKTHASEQTAYEICGVLVGRWARDDDGPFVWVTESIRGDAAENRHAEVTFTHETWDEIHRQMDSKFSDLNIVGWYHSHPDFGVFLSDRDMFIQQHFFSGAGQIALVIDPIRKQEGVFVWREGRAVECPHFWVGDDVQLSSAAEQTRRSQPADMPSPGIPDAVATDSSEPLGDAPALPLLMTVVPFLAVFLLGYLLAGWRSSRENERLEIGALAQFAVWNIIRPGLHQHLTEVGGRLDEAYSELQALQPGDSAAPDSDGAKGSDGKEDDEETASSPDKRWQAALRKLRTTRTFVNRIDERYSLTPTQRDFVERLVAEEIARRKRRLAAPKDKGKQSTETNKDGDADKSSAKSPAAQEPSPPRKPAGPEPQPVTSDEK